ncbi:MAG: P-II family nitrogen regulator [Nitrosopumilus sp.]|uniref:P-II family nitrogen regulator n=1 Tax=Nitrosopumilus sp. TaxID=2024843 RepID=UPI0029306D00|nr:P-II family nitrogen regulator [Nitrosopumilus sp.]
MSTMKRLAVLVKNEKVDIVVAALRELDLDAIIYDVKSAGKEKRKVKSGRGTGGVIDAAYFPRKIIATVVESDKSQEVSAAIKKAMSGESKGVVIVTPVDDFIPF